MSENTEGLASSLIVELCKHNLHASEKVAIVLIKSLYKTTFIYVQPYLNIIEEYCLIDDAYQDLRISWVLGKQTLCVTTYHKTIAALSSSYNY